MNSTKAKVGNFIGFQIVWFAVVLSAAEGRPWIGIATAVGWIAIHAALVPNGRRELASVAGIAAAGCAIDQIAVAYDLQRFDPNAATIGLVPVWIAALWASFATTLNVSLGWMHGRYVLAAILGACFGPLAYLGAERLGAVDLSGRESWISLCGIGIEWAIMMPLALAFAGRVGRPRPD